MKKKQILSFLMTIAMVINTTPFSAAAEEGNITFSSAPQTVTLPGFGSGSLEASAGSAQITVEYGADAEIPATAELQAKAITAGDAYDAYSRQLNSLYADSETGVVINGLYELSITNEGEPVVPKANVNTAITLPDGTRIAKNNLHVVRFGNEATEIADPAVSGTTVSFSDSSLSVYGIASTKDLHYWIYLEAGEHEFSLKKYFSNKKSLGTELYDSICNDTSCSLYFFNSDGDYVWDYSYAYENGNLVIKLLDSIPAGDYIQLAFYDWTNYRWLENLNGEFLTIYFIAPQKQTEVYSDGTFTYEIDRNTGTAVLTGLDDAAANQKNLTIPESIPYSQNRDTKGATLAVTSIAPNAFRGRSGLNVTIPGNITVEGSYVDDGNGSTGAFAYCSDSTVTFTGRNVTLGGSAFQGCKNLTVKHLYSGENGSLVLGQKAFAFAENVNLVTGSSVTVSGSAYNVFQRTSGELTFLGGVSSIGGYSFIDSAFTRITTTPRDAYKWNDYGLSNLSTKIPVTILAADSDESITWSRWNFVSSLTIEFDDPITTCPGFSSLGNNGSVPVIINFFGGISRIPAGTFDNLHGAAGTQVNIRGEASEVEAGSFPDDTNLTVNFEMFKSAVSGAEKLDTLAKTKVTYNFERYHDDMFWYDLNTDDPEHVTAEITGIWDNYTGTELVISGLTRNGDAYTVANVPENAFRGNKDITSVVFTNANEIHVQGGAFRNMSALQTVRFSGTGTVNIGTADWDYTFGYCPLLTTVTGAEDSSVSFNVMGIFQGCSSLKNVQLGNVPKLSRNTFIDNAALETFEANNIGTISMQAFNRCTNLQSFKANGNVETIESWAFDGSKPLTNVEIDGNVGTINSSAFGTVSSMDTFIILGNTGTIKSYAVRASSLRVAVMKGKVTKLESYAFYGDAFGQDNNLIYVGSLSGYNSLSGTAFGWNRGNAYFNVTYDQLYSALGNKGVYTLHTNSCHYSNQDSGEDVYIRENGSNGYGTSATDTWNSFSTAMYAMYNDLDSQNRFYRDCAAAGVADLGLAFSGDLKADFSGFTVHVFAAKGTAEASFPADMYGEMLESHSFISGAPAVFSAVKEIVFENDANTVNIPAGAMQKFTGLQEVRILNENAKAMIGKNAFAGLNVTTECTAEQTVESEAGTVTLAKGTNAPIGTKLVLQASAEDHTAAVLEAAKSNGLFGDIPENQIRIRSFDMFLTAPDGSRVDTAATVQISQKTSEYSGSMTVFPNEFAFFHLEGGTAKLMTDEFTANLSTGIMTYGFDTDGFSPYAAAYTLDVSEVSDGVFTYLADRNGNATITGYDKGFSGNALNIPGRTVIGDASYKVIGIADGALKTPPEGISITSVTFNNEDTLNVGSGAMSGLSEIQTVYFNGTGSVVFSDGTVFSGSGTASVEVSMPNGLTAQTGDGEYGTVFSGLNGGYTLTVDSITSIPANAFRNDKKLTAVTVLSALENTGKFKPSSSMYRSDYNLGAVGTGSFEGAENLESFTVAGESSGIAIGNEAFRDCSSLTVLSVNGTINGLGENALTNTAFTSLTINADKLAVGKEALGYCPNMTSLEINGDVINFDNYAFGGTGSGATKLTYLTFNGAVKRQLFDELIRGEKLQVLVFKGGMNGASDNFVYAEDTIEAPALTVYISGEYEDDPYLSDECFPASQQVRIYLNLPISREDAGQTYWLRRAENVVDLLYSKETAPTDVYVDTDLDEDDLQNGSENLPFCNTERAVKAVNATYDHARFRQYFVNAGYDPDAHGLTFAEGSAEVTAFTLHLAGGTSAMDTSFRGDSRLIGVEIDVGGDITLDSEAFKDCENLSKVSIKAGGSIAIGDSVFENDTAITDPEISNTANLTIGRQSFRGCAGITQLNIRSAADVTIGMNAFRETALESAAFDQISGTVAIEESAFRDLETLTLLEITGSSTRSNAIIRTGAFAGCGPMDQVLVKNIKDPTVESGAFDGPIDVLLLEGGAANVQSKAFSSGKYYIDRSDLFDFNLTDRIGRFEDIILANPQSISASEQVFSGNDDLRMVYLGKGTSITGAGGEIFSGMPDTAIAYVAHKSTDFTDESSRPVRPDGILRFLDNGNGLKYIDGTKKYADGIIPDGSLEKPFTTFAQAKASIASASRGDNSRTDSTGSRDYYYADAANDLRTAYASAGIAVTEQEIRFPVPQTDTGSRVFYVTGTVYVSGEETWESDEDAVITLIRDEGFSGRMVSNSGTLTLKNVILDGVNYPVDNELINSTGTLNIREGTEIRNNNRTVYSNPNGAGGIYASGTVNMDGGAITGNTGIMGGGIQVYGHSAEFNMSGGIIDHNSIEPGNADGTFTYGGGVMIGQGAVMNLSGEAVISNNHAGGGSGLMGGAGGGITLGANYDFTAEQATLNMTGGTIIGNDSNHGGGGLYIQDNCVANISSGRILNNTAHGSEFGGGGIYVNGDRAVKSGVLRLSNVLITNNRASEEGGGLAGCNTSSSNVYHIDGGAIYGNSAKYNSDVYVDTILRPTSTNPTGAGSMTGYVSPYMFNGALYNWTDSRTGESLTAAQLADLHNLIHESRVTLTANPDGSQPTSASVIITGNVSYTKGGGIGANGTVYIGTPPEPQKVTWTPEASKILWNRDMKEGETFTFKVFQEQDEGEYYWWHNYTDILVGTGTVTGGKDGQPKAITFTTISVGGEDKLMNAADIGSEYTYLIVEDETDSTVKLLPRKYLACTITIATRLENGEEKYYAEVLRKETGNIRDNGDFEYSDTLYDDDDPSENATGSSNFGRIRSEAGEAVFNNYATRTDISVTKKWLRADGSSTPPEGASVILELYADGKPTGMTITLDGTADEDGEPASWTATWKDLEIFGKEGDPESRIEYSVKEVSVTGTDRFAVAAEAVAINGSDPAVLVNREQETTERTVRKVWDDDGNRDGMRPASIRMTLTANGSMVQQVTLSDENGWTATVSGLPADLDGKPIAYAWSEPEITNYTQESTETTGTVTIFTNRIVRIPEELPPDEPQPKKPKGGWRPAVFEDYATAMGGESLFNHTGDCFD